MKISQLQSLIVKFRNQRNWKQFHNAKDMAISLSLEASELLELCQWKTEKEADSYFKSQPSELKDELADIFYWLLLISHDYNIDLETALKAKLKKNSRKYPVSKAKNNKLKYNKLKGT